MIITLSIKILQLQKWVNTRRISSQLFEKKTWVPPWSWGKHSCLSPRDPKFESTLKSSKKWTQKLSVQFYFFIHFMHVYITKDDIKVAKVQSNLSKITIPFWTVCKYCNLPSKYFQCTKKGSTLYIPISIL